MNNILTIKYFLESHPNPDFKYTKLILLLMGIFFVISIALKIYRRKYVKDEIVKRIIKHYPSKFFSFGVIIFLLLFVREAGIPFLSMRIWWIVLLLYIIYWGGKACLDFKKEYRKRSNKTAVSDIKTKYLPKKKK